MNISGKTAYILSSEEKRFCRKNKTFIQRYWFILLAVWLPLLNDHSTSFFNHYFDNFEDFSGIYPDSIQRPRLQRWREIWAVPTFASRSRENTRSCTFLPYARFLNEGRYLSTSLLLSALCSSFSFSCCSLRFLSLRFYGGNRHFRLVLLRSCCDLKEPDLSL